MWAWVVTNRWILAGVAGATVMALATAAVVKYGNDKYDEGVLAERAVWEKVVAEAGEARDRAIGQLNQIRQTRDMEAARLRRERDQALAQVREDIRNAETVEDQFAVYVRHRDSVRHETADRLARARADYLSSLAVAGGNAAGTEPSRSATDDSRRKPVRCGPSLALGNHSRKCGSGEG